MPTETELKLRIDPASINVMLNSGLFESEPDLVEQTSVYFDTPEHALRKGGYSLRIRDADGRRTQTVKATTPASAGLFARSEWERLVEDDNPVLDHSTPLQNQIGKELEGLAPLFEVVVERRKWVVTEGQSEIEIALDKGFIRAADRHVPICEIELELKGGGIEGIFDLARKLGGVVAFHFEVMTKAERGYRLLETAKTVFKAEPLSLEPSSNVTGALQQIAASCFRHFRLNEAFLLDRRNPESLHQARVALRRLRSAFSTFKPVTRDAESSRLCGELKWLAAVLGEARNIDVMLKESKEDPVRKRLLGARAQAYDDVVNALTSERARLLMLDFNRWLVCGDWLRDPASTEHRGMPAEVFGVAALDRLRKRMKKHGGGFSETDDEHRHQVRKDAKKLRYAAEFFGTLFDGKKAKRRYRRFIDLMATLQDGLGSLNDIATRPQVLQKLGIETDAIRAGVNSKADLIGKAEDALADVLEAKRFWR